jgi:hypothetical protein
MLKLIQAETPPSCLFLGKVGLPFIKQAYEQKLAVWEQWADVSVEAHG